ncbi:MAG: hypothetical protein MUD08_04115 [Cytophagales bacterium]|jgi:hypothetical protein|nr:hypothetical protein [Cytophagales bacterium]
MTRYLAFPVLLVLLAGCSAERKLTNRLEGRWEVARYETTNSTAQSVQLSNIGTIEFDKDRSGRRDISYNAFQTRFAVSPRFQWSNTDRYVTIRNASSDSAKAWIVLENRRGYQKWTSTDGSTGVQVLELRKPDQKGVLGL